MSADDQRHTDPAPQIAAPANAQRVDGWELHEDGYQRFFAGRERTRTALSIHVVGFQRADGSCHDVQIFVGDVPIELTDADNVLSDLRAAYGEARSIAGQ